MRTIGTDRIRCLILGCRRTAPADKWPPNTTIICGQCWSLAPKYLRRRARKLERILLKLGHDIHCVQWGDAPPGSPARRALVLHSENFDRMKKAITETRVGL